MEARIYWQKRDEEEKRRKFQSRGGGLSHNVARVDSDPSEDIFLHDGKMLSFDNYLTVPTYLRKGIELGV